MRQTSERCEYIKQNGERCRLRTRRSFLCWHHQSKQDGVRIKKSGIPNAGLGLFADKNLKKNDKVPYGKDIPIVDNLREEDHYPYAIEYTKRPKTWINPTTTTQILGASSNIQ